MPVAVHCVAAGSRWVKEERRESRPGSPIGARCMESMPELSVEDRQQRSAEQEKGAWCAPIDAVVAGRPRAQRWKRAAEQYAGCEGGVSEIARPPVITGQTKRDRAGRVEDDRASSLRRPIQCAHKLLQIFESA